MRQMFIEATCVDKRIKRPFLGIGQVRYFITLYIPIAKFGQRTKEYELDMEDYYKVNINDTRGFKFTEYKNLWYLNGSYI